MRNQIIICSDLDRAYGELLPKLGNNYKLFERDDFLIEDAHALISAAYIATDTHKYLIAKSSSFNVVSQNALLKVIEESPPKISIIFIAPSKAIFLPTIRSRMSIHRLHVEKRRIEVDFDFAHMTLKSVFEQVKSCRFLPKSDAKTFIEAAFSHYLSLAPAQGLKRQQELELFEQSFRLIELNGSAQSILLSLLLMLLEKGQEGRRRAV